MKVIIRLTILIVLATSCTNNPSKLSVAAYGEINGKQINRYTITFEDQLKVELINYGGIITSLYIPDKEGKLEDIVLGYDSLQGYLDKTPYFGALIGRYGNRIAKGQFYLDSIKYTLATNNGPNHLHGGIKGFDKVVWNVLETVETENEVIVTLEYISKDGEEGYPGNLKSTVTYRFSPDGIRINYQATTDKKTIVNLTNHSYFNLSGNAKEDILGHILQLDANQFLPVDSTLIPTGEIQKVYKTPFDFTTIKTIGIHINQENEQLQYGLGYDHCWVLDGGKTKDSRKVGSLYHETSGRFMEIFTTEPGIQFYSGNFLDGTITGKGGKVYKHRYGLCLETQHFPDSPNQTSFPKVILNPGELYQSETFYRFSVK